MFHQLLRIGLVLLIMTPVCRATAEDRPLKHRWLYMAYNLAVDENVKTVQQLMKRAQAAGYNGVLLADFKFQILDRMSARYFQNVESVKRTAQELGLEIYPCVCPIGYSEGLLSHDPNLVEGQPVRDALFVVKNGQAELLPDPAVSLRNGDFETAKNNKFVGWGFQDFIGQSSFADRDVHHGGSQSLRMENIGKIDPQHGHGRIQQKVTVSPWRQYHLSVWIKTSEFETPGNIHATILANGHSLSHVEWEIKKTQDWTQYHTIFNSQENTEALIYLGVWNGKGGTIWWDDAVVEEAGLLNIIRRDGCPLVVKNETGMVYEEGRDFLPVRDERMGMVPYAGCYEVYHQPAVLKLAPNSRIKEGDRLRISFYHSVTVHNGQATCCLSDPKVYTLLKDQIERVNKLLQPKGFFLSHDEIRVANWCESCTRRKLTPGQLLADNVQRCVEMVRAVNPKAELFTWNDMFDPAHNAHDNYYLVNGTWAGSWEGLPKDVVIANWHFGKRQENMPWFAQRGHAQILAGYYDHNPGQIRTWLDDARNVPNVIGVMYTTWGHQYQDLEAFAKAAWGK